MASKVYFMDDRASGVKESLVAKMLTVFDAAGFADIIKPGDSVAIKLHMGEHNNTAYLRPVYVRALVDKIKSLGGDPFVVDTTTLLGLFASRATAVDYLKTAARNGFTLSSLGCPVIIGDGFIGNDDERVDLPEGFILQEQYVASAIALADAMIALSHFKGHPVGTYGGAIKNIGVGCASKRGKYNLHLSRHPKYGFHQRPLYPERCKGRACASWQSCEVCCPEGAIQITETTINWNRDKCHGCFACVGVLHCGAMEMIPDWFDATTAAIADSARAAVKTFAPGKVGFVTLAIDIVPWCDCVPFSDRPLIPNMGVFASYDPVAMDTACVKMAQQSEGILGSAAEEHDVMAPGTMKFAHCSSWMPGGAKSEDVQLNAGVYNGLGSKEHEVIEVGKTKATSNFLYVSQPLTPRFGEHMRVHPVFPAGGFKWIENVDLNKVR
ncbi:MAG: DUF362 domain-containing protein [Candidatus Tectomicrobia bacterium]|uniref:DUF362 domain-containing protein n=1 Tax=Tectimicrobiota bacterium TaxID=2528274 RepID=A0A932CLZ0_UNCTE|nr:DUF362 domain-containing protein [Candidatus Tectomicrobia bacterium]